MKTITAPAIAAIATGRIGIVQLIHLAFSTTPVSLNMSTWDFVWQPPVNFLRYSEQFDNAAWIPFFGGTKGAYNASTAPDGTATADAVEFTTLAIGQIYQLVALTVQKYTLTAWVKRNAASDQTFRLKGQSGEGSDVYSANFVATDAWQRFSHTFTSNSAFTASISIAANSLGITASLLVWGAQLEPGEIASAYTLTTSVAINDPSITYKGAYGLGTVSAIADKPGEVAGLQFELAAGSSGVISLALDDADIVQGTAVTVRTAIIDMDTRQILDAPIEWTGTLDTMSIGEDGTQAVVRCTAESKAVDLLRGTPMVYGDADQRTINAADGSMRYIVDQIDKPVIWPQKAFFYQ